MARGTEVQPASSGFRNNPRQGAPTSRPLLRNSIHLRLRVKDPSTPTAIQSFSNALANLRLKPHENTRDPTLELLA